MVVVYFSKISAQNGERAAWNYHEGVSHLLGAQSNSSLRCEGIVLNCACGFLYWHLSMGNQHRLPRCLPKT